MIAVTSFIAILSTLMLVACVISVRKSKLSDKDHETLSKWAVEGSIPAPAIAAMCQALMMCRADL